MTKATMTKKIKEIIKNAACEEEIITTVMELFDDEGMNLLEEIRAPKTHKTKVSKPEPKTKSQTKTTKKSTNKKTEATTVQANLKAFTGMNIGTYTAKVTKTGYVITTKSGKEIEFNKDGTQKIDCRNPKFNNRLEIIAEA